jgi:integrase
MASFSITKRKKADGTSKYRCLVRVKEKGQVLYNESRTFSKQAPAKEWGKRKVEDIERNGIPGAANEDITVGALIQLYMDDPYIELGRTKLNVLRLLTDCDISSIVISALTPQHVIEHCKLRRSGGTSAATVSHDVSYLRSVLKVAKPTWGYNINDSCITEAYHSLHELKLIGKSERRTRRPTSIEIDKLTVGLTARQEKRSAIIPYIDILEFSILSCMRIGEVCAILWTDVNTEQRAVIVRNRKDPRKKTGNHMLVPLLGGAWEILQKQPKNKEQVFPFNSRSVSAGYQRVRNSLGIEDLRYHDLRREGASRLFEKGYHVDEVAQVTGHRNINTLWNIYTELYPNRLHDKDEQSV